MGFERRSVVFFILLFAICNIDAKQLADSIGNPTFGPYDIHLNSLKACHSDKRPQANATFFLSSRQNEEGHIFVSANLTLHEDIGPVMGRIRIMKWVDGKYNQIMDYSQESVCNYFLSKKSNFLPIKVDFDSKCVFKKAEYVLPEQETDTSLRFVMGKNFFYGKFKILFEWFTETHLLLCTRSVMEFTPPKKSSDI